jgi:hypothetical protein
MTKIAMYKDKQGRLLVIWKTRNENLVGEVFNDGVEKRGKWSMRATFYVADGDATEFRVCEYFNFPYPNAYWRRWA